MQWIGEEFEKALPWIQRGGAIISIFDPALGAVFNTTASIVGLVEQKYAALGKSSGTGAQKLADALQIGEPIISQALKLAGNESDTAAVTAKINAVVNVLNTMPVQGAALNAKQA
jgi:L-serine deaminase